MLALYSRLEVAEGKVSELSINRNDLAGEQRLKKNEQGHRENEKCFMLENENKVKMCVCR